MTAASSTPPTGRSRRCPKCGVIGRLYRHGAKPVSYRDIPVLGKPLIIKAKVMRYRCRDCGGTSLQALPDMDTQRRMTRRLVDYVGEQDVHQTFSSIARHVFPRQAFLEVHHLRPAGGQVSPRPMVLCASCHRRIHTEPGDPGGVSSTRESG